MVAFTHHLHLVCTLGMPPYTSHDFMVLVVFGYMKYPVQLKQAQLLFSGSKSVQAW